jgi:hypothetical protein
MTMDSAYCCLLDCTSKWFKVPQRATLTSIISRLWNYNSRAGPFATWNRASTKFESGTYPGNFQKLQISTKCSRSFRCQRGPPAAAFAYLAYLIHFSFYPSLWRQHHAIPSLPFSFFVCVNSAFGICLHYRPVSTLHWYFMILHYRLISCKPQCPRIRFQYLCL